MKQSLEKEVWIKKIEKLREGSDLSRDEDLSIGLMNLVSLEEHFYFTAMKTGDRHYLDMLQAVRAIRTKILAKIVTSPQGEEWCISKHLLAASMRFIEVGTKEFAKQRHKEAEEYFTAAFELYSLFFAINYKMIKTGEMVNRREDKEPNEVIKNDKPPTAFSNILKKVLDCCKEW